MRKGPCAFISVLLSASVLFSGCMSDVDYNDRTEEITKVLKGEVRHFFDNGYIISGNAILVPYECSSDDFYLIGSPDELDSVFMEINYPSMGSPRLDTLFPEEGELLIYDCHEIRPLEELKDYSISVSGDTLRLALCIREWMRPGPPPQSTPWYCVFPIGIVFDQP